MECDGVLWEQIFKEMKRGGSGRLSGFPDVIISEVVYWSPQWALGKLKDETGGSCGDYGICKLFEMLFKDYV